MCRRSGYTTRRKDVTSSRGSKKGDLEIQDINLGGQRDLVIDVALVHDFSRNLRDAHRNGQLRYDDPNLLLNTAASAEVAFDLSAKNSEESWSAKHFADSLRIRHSVIHILRIRHSVIHIRHVSGIVFGVVTVGLRVMPLKTLSDWYPTLTILSRIRWKIEIRCVAIVIAHVLAAIYELQ